MTERIIKTLPKPSPIEPFICVSDICLVVRDTPISSTSGDDTITNTLKAGSPVIIKHITDNTVLVEDADGVEWTVPCYRDRHHLSFGGPIGKKEYKQLTNAWTHIRFKLSEFLNHDPRGHAMQIALFLLMFAPLFVGKMLDRWDPEREKFFILPWTLFQMVLVVVCTVFSLLPEGAPCVMSYHSHYKTMSRELKTLFHKSTTITHPSTKS